MQPDLWLLYRQMLRSRFFEQRIKEIWKKGLISGKMAAVALESGLSLKYSRVCTEETIPYARQLEDKTLPGTDRIVDSALKLMES